MHECRLRCHWSLFPSLETNKIPALLQIMAWRRLGDKPLPEPMMLTNWGIYASLGLNEFSRNTVIINGVVIQVNIEIRCTAYYSPAYKWTKERRLKTFKFGILPTLPQIISSNWIVYCIDIYLVSLHFLRHYEVFCKLTEMGLNFQI